MKTKEITNNERRILLIMGLFIFNFYFLSIFGFVAEQVPMVWRVSAVFFGGIMIWISQ